MIIIYARCCKITIPQAYFGFSYPQTTVNFIDFSRIVASSRCIGRSANECSDRKNSEIYSLVYNDHFIDGHIIPRACHSLCDEFRTRRRCFTTQYHVPRIISTNRNLCMRAELHHNEDAILFCIIYSLIQSQIGIFVVRGAW